MSDFIRDRVSALMKDAMRGQDKTRLSTLRLISAAFKDRESRTVAQVRMTASRKAECRKFVENDQAAREFAETYKNGGTGTCSSRGSGNRDHRRVLPRQLSIAEIEAAVSGVVKELDASGLKDMGRVMSVLKERHAGQMDFAKAGAIVKNLLG